MERLQELSRAFQPNLPATPYFGDYTILIKTSSSLNPSREAHHGIDAIGH